MGRRLNNEVPAKLAFRFEFGSPGPITKPGSMPIATMLKAGGERDGQISDAHWLASLAQSVGDSIAKIKGEKRAVVGGGIREGNGVKMKFITLIYETQAIKN